MIRILTSIVTMLLFNQIIWAQSCSCYAVFKSVDEHLVKDYAGWFDKMKTLDPHQFQNLRKSTELKSKSIQQDSACYNLVSNYVKFFDDKHLQLRYKKPNSSPARVAGTPVAIERSKRTEQEMTMYFNNKLLKDPIEGVWENETYTIGMVRHKANKFIGIVFSSENEKWKPQEVKCYVEKKANQTYKLTFITGDKQEKITREAKLIKNILDADEFLFRRILPKTSDTLLLTEYAHRKDSTRIKLNFPDKQTLCWVLPNLYDQNAEVLEKLIQQHRRALETTPNWIIDLRNNEGGDVRIGFPLLPYLYTRPIEWSSEKIRLTENNFNNLYNTYIKDAIAQVSEEEKAQYDSVFAITRTHFGEFGNLYNETKLADTIVYNQVKSFPKKVVVLINSDTFSSGELFSILARQSDKVTVLGMPSAGSIDYGNILRYPTPCPTLELRLPCSRNNWLDAGISIDRDKVQPDRILDQSTDWIQEALQEMQNN
jgi:hypothetical protein